MRLVAFLALAGSVLFSSAAADEGMWLFNDLPRQLLQQKYGFAAPQEWTDHLMKSSVRFNVGGSGSFISSTGLVLTNHHVGSDTLGKLSTAERNILERGYLAADLSQELKAPDLELNQLLQIRDVTAEVQAAVTSEMTPEQALGARRAVIARIEKAAQDATGLKCTVTTLYGGGRYHLYHYKKYTDVRLVWAPETAIAFFGGDADNFEYPRYCLDACIFRVYENDKPAKTEHFLKWSADGPAEGEVVFVSGHPGRTSRSLTVDALRYQRDVAQPAALTGLRRQEIVFQQYSLRGRENARRARELLFSVQNSRKARLGMLAGLQDPDVMAGKATAEKQLLQQLSADARLQPLADAWVAISKTTARRREIQNGGVPLNSRLFSIALQLVQMAEEDQKPSEQRLPEFADAGRESFLQQLYSPAPIYADLEQVILADSISRTLEARGFDDPLCQQILAGKAPADRAAELISGTALADVAARRSLGDSGIRGIESSKDPLIQLARDVLPELRKVRAVTDELDEQERQAYAKIAEARFAVLGTTVYPDATFTLRLAFGPVLSYQQGSDTIPAMTTLGEAFQHEQAHTGQSDYVLPESWKLAREKLNPKTPFNFVSTADIIGGNSGSPVVNRAGELVGLIFDGNIQSLSGNYVYTDRQSRSVSVHSSALREALEVVYGATSLVKELGR